MIASSSDSPSSAVGSPYDLVNRLRALLANEKRSPETQDRAVLDGIIDQLAAQYARDKDSELSLHTIAVLGVAAQAGSKSARKVAFNLGRWNECAPPALSILPTSTEQLSALKRLSTVTFYWLPSYALSIATNFDIDKSVRSQALKICAKHIPDQSKLIDLVAGQIQAGSLDDLLGTLFALLPAVSRGHGSALTASFDRLCTVVLARLEAQMTSDDGSAAGRCGDRLVAILEILVKTDPGALLTQASLRAIVAISRMRSLANARPCKRFDSILGTVWSIAHCTLTAHTEQSASDIAIRLQWVAQTTPLLKIAKTLRPDKDPNVLLDAACNVGQVANDFIVAHALVDSIADLVRLLPEDEDPGLDAHVVSDLIARIVTTARLAGVEKIGTRNEVLPFDPVTQFLDVSEGEAPLRVRITKPGIGARRANGSLRIVVKPIVCRNEV